jgi:hypothetical protein
MAPHELREQVYYCRSSNGAVEVSNDGKVGTYKEEGLAAAAVTINPKVPSLKKWGYIDHSGRWIVKPKFKSAASFSEGLALVTILKGNWIIQPKFSSGHRFSEGLAWVSVSTTDWRTLQGFIDRNGNWIVKPKFATADNFSEGLDSVSIPTPNGRSYGYIDRKGDFVTPAAFESAHSFSEGLAAVGIKVH